MINFLREKLIESSIELLKNGPIPQHVAFICDGNRRYAKDHNISQKDSYLRSKGIFELIKKFFRKIGVKEVSFFVFAIENFKRSDEEKATLFDLFREEIEVNEHKSVQMKDQDHYCVRFVGAIELLPCDIQLKLAKGMIKSFEIENPKMTVNFNACYSGMFDITQTADQLTSCVKNDLLQIEEITSDHLERTLWSSTPVDLLIRTSGEIRFSDYLLWQCNYSNLCFLDKNWPEIGEFQILASIFYFQMNTMRRNFRNETRFANSKLDEFLIQDRKTRFATIEKVPICRYNDKLIR